MTGATRSALAALMIMAAAGGSHAQEPPFNRDIRDLKATVLDL
jgi:hypothetical protein